MDPSLSAEEWIVRSRQARRDRRISRQVVKSEREQQQQLNRLIGPLHSALLRLGFVQVSKSRSGSRYFILPPMSLRLRLSDHALPPHIESRKGNLGLSVKVEEASTPEVALQAIDIAVRFLAMCRLRMVRPDLSRDSTS